MTHRLRRSAALLAALAAAPLSATTTASAAPAEEARVLTGALADGAAYRLEVPPAWNGTVVLYSHGLRFPGEDNPPETAASDASRQWMLDNGYALAGSSYAGTGWAVEEAVDDQLGTLDAFTARVGAPTRTIALGESLGGLVTTALVERHPERFDGGLSLCGLHAGGPALWDSYLDGAYVLRTLLPESGAVRITGVDDPLGNLDAAQRILSDAAATAAGRARIALAAAVMQVPGAVDPLAPFPADAAGRAAARLAWMTESFPVFAFAERGELEARAGGNPSTNVGVDYERMLRDSEQRSDVRALYRAAGLDLDDDLATLAAAPRVAADPVARTYLSAHGGLTNAPAKPLLTLHGTADGLVPSSHERAYAERAGRPELLRQAFVDRPGHCTFTSAEIVSAFGALQERLDSGVWHVKPAFLNQRAAELGPELNTGAGIPVAPAFVRHHPLAFPRA
ncbi:alpha/beta hydrolase family protein [Motilibacter deserti]|uniref:Prolyl oligopeptidase family protein n=1 Tax=Motilibacter deserti TaxID=2714956 RepID=A0ABX0GQ40_9ACTN|nr:hypothetical protein [Motilibacter deserti]NHC12949.1 hypothetical protein [Motilibacter deserti]